MRMRQNRTGETDRLGAKEWENLRGRWEKGAGERDLVGINQEGFPGMKGRLQGQLLITRCPAIDTMYVICWETSERIAKEWQKSNTMSVMFQDVDTGYYVIHNVRPKLQKCYRPFEASVLAYIFEFYLWIWFTSLFASGNNFRLCPRHWGSTRMKRQGPSGGIQRPISKGQKIRKQVT